MSNVRLDGKVAIVTGAGSTIGLGRAMTLALVQAGARVAMMDIDAPSLAQTADDAMRIGGRDRVVQVVGDVSQPSDAQRVVETAMRELGGLDILVNNAGITPSHAGLTGSGVAPFWEVPAEAWFRVAAVNYVGPALLAAASIKPMLARKWGRIIGVTTSLDTMF